MCCNTLAHDVDSHALLRVFYKVLLKCRKVWSTLVYYVDAHTLLRILLQGTLYTCTHLCSLSSLEYTIYHKVM